MGEDSKIEWTDHTFNPWEGCVKVSPECDNCYAATRDVRLHHGDNWGPDAKRLSHKDAYWEQPLKWNADARKDGVRKRVFCGSLCDIMERHRNDWWQGRLNYLRALVFRLVELTDNLDWLFLTKRPQEYRKLLPPEWIEAPRSNVWLGTTVGIETSLWRADALKGCPAVVHFLSVEPLLGPLPTLGEYLDGISWVICGGESGPGARPMDPDWARSVRDQCANAGVPFLFKQWGEWYPISTVDGMIKVGKHKAGRLLDGVEHNGFPEVAR